jgi:hypothetical protein
VSNGLQNWKTPAGFLKRRQVELQKMLPRSSIWPFLGLAAVLVLYVILCPPQFHSLYNFKTI